LVARLTDALARSPSLWSGLRSVFEGEAAPRLVGEHARTGRWLDVGCGVGTLASCFDPARYLGIDRVTARIESARLSHHRHSFVQADATEDLRSLGRFSGFLLVHVLHHLADPQVAALAARLRAVALPRARLLVIDPYPPRTAGAPLLHSLLLRGDTGQHHRCPAACGGLLGAAPFASGTASGTRWFSAYWLTAELGAPPDAQ
jgi:SAM-dependent methyltransferase